MKFANILLENNPRAIAYPGMYCKADQPVVFDDETADWVMLRAGVFGKLGGRCCDGCERGRRRRRTCPVAVGRLLSLARQSS